MTTPIVCAACNDKHTIRMITMTGVVELPCPLCQSSDEFTQVTVDAKGHITQGSTWSTPFLQPVEYDDAVGGAAEIAAWKRAFLVAAKRSTPAMSLSLHLPELKRLLREMLDQGPYEACRLEPLFYKARVLLDLMDEGDHE